MFYAFLALGGSVLLVVGMGLECFVVICCGRGREGGRCRIVMFYRLGGRNGGMGVGGIMIGTAI